MPERRSFSRPRNCSPTNHDGRERGTIKSPPPPFYVPVNVTAVTSIKEDRHHATVLRQTKEVDIGRTYVRILETTVK